MKRFEKKLADRLRAGTDPGGDGERQDLWARLEERLPVATPPPPPTARFVGRPYWLVVVVLLLSVAATLSRTVWSTVKTPETTVMPGASVPPEPLVGVLPDRPISLPESSENTTSATREEDRLTAGTGPDVLLTDPDAGVPTMPVVPILLPVPSPPGVGSRRLPATDFTKAEPIASAFRKRAVSRLPVPLPFLNFAPARRRLPTVEAGPLATAKFKKTADRKFEVGASVGTNVLLRRFTGSEDASLGRQLKAVTGLAAGRQVGLEISYRFTPNWRVTGGLEYLRAHNTFDYQASYDTTIAHPSFPQGDAISATVDRVLRYNNHLRMVSVPLLLEYGKRVGALDVSLGAGVGMNFLEYQRGATLTATGRPVFFDRRTDRQFSYHLRPRIGWSAGRGGRLRYFIGAEARWLDVGADLPEGTTGSGLLLGGQLGVRWRL